MYKHPIGRCPKCRHSILYSHNPKDKINVIITIADDNSEDNMVMCAKCKTMLNVKNKILKSKIVPIYNLNI